MHAYPTKREELVQLSVRVPKSLLKWAADVAKKTNRSRSQVITWALERAREATAQEGRA